jgi:predicted HAD superfamily phosphohydrolase
MKAKLLILLVLASVLVWCGFANAQKKAWGIPDKETQKTEVKIDKSKVSPEFRKILEAEEKAMKEIEELNEKMESLNGNQIADLQKEVEKIKRDTEIEILKIRLGIAKERNDAKSIQEIEKAIDQLENPPPVAEDEESKALGKTLKKGNGEK